MVLASTDTALPIRDKLLTDSVDPKRLTSKTDSENREPSRINPHTDTAEATRAKLLTENDAPRVA